MPPAVKRRLVTLAAAQSPPTDEVPILPYGRPNRGNAIARLFMNGRACAIVAAVHYWAALFVISLVRTDDWGLFFFGVVLAAIALIAGVVGVSLSMTDSFRVERRVRGSLGVLLNLIVICLTLRSAYRFLYL